MGNTLNDTEKKSVNYAMQERTLIAKKTTIVGDIISQEPLSIEGIVNGSVVSDSVVGITGQINGDVSAARISIAKVGAHVMGTVKSEDTADIMEGAAILGDVIAKGDVTINGMVKGSIDSDATVDIASTAYIAGNVVAKNVHIADGSKIRGRVELKFEAEQYDEELALAEIEKNAKEQIATRKLPDSKVIIDAEDRIYQNQKFGKHGKSNRSNDYNDTNLAHEVMG